MFDSRRPPRGSTPEELANLRTYWRWLLALGLGMVALGTFAIGWSCIVSVTVAATWMLGFVLLASGITEVLNAFNSGRWSGMLVHLLIGIIYAVVGIIIIDQPVDAALNLTLVIAVFLIIGGLFRMVFAISERFEGWGWVLLNGGVSLMMGLLIYKQWPASGLWVIGMFIGVDLIFNGWSWVMLAMSLRRVALNQPPASSQPTG